MRPAVATGICALLLFLFLMRDRGTPVKSTSQGSQAQAAKATTTEKTKTKRTKPPFVFAPRQARVYSRPIPIDRASDIAALSQSQNADERALGDAWDAAVIASLEEHYEETKKCLEGYLQGKAKGEAREWVLYLEIVDSEVVEVWAPEWPYDFRAKEFGCFARAIEGARIEGIRDERRLLKTDIALVL
jgi:hypothetical protein